MPLDAARWQIDILAADKTADAFASATARMKAFGDASAGTANKAADSAKAGTALYDAIAGKLKEYAKAAAAAVTVAAAIAKGKEIEDYANTVDKLAKSFKVSTLEAQALEAAARQTGKTAEDLNAQLSVGQKKLLTDTYKAAFGDTTRILEDVSNASNRLSDAWNDLSEASHQSMIAMFGDITASVLNGLTDALREWSVAVRDAGAVLSRVAKSPQIPSVASFIESGQNVSAGIGGGFPTMDAGPLASAMDIVAAKTKTTQAEIDRLKDLLQKTRDEFDRDGDRAGILAADIAQFEAGIRSLTGALVGLNNIATGTAASLSPFAGKGIDLGPLAFKGAGSNVIQPYLPGPSQLTRWMAEGLKPPATGGGGGGKSDNESVDAQIKRYQALADVAKRAGETIGANRQQNIEDLKREVSVQQQVEEIAAKLGAKYAEADQALKDKLHGEIDLYEKRKAANQLALDSAQKAEDIELKLGDGTRARAALERDLARAKDSGRASTEALMRVEAQRSEELEHQRLQAKRYDDNLGSLAAGFQDAANSYARANDMFSQGGQLFAGVTSALGDGLDVLMGKSAKTFGEIASGFAMMLVKMELQAAASNIWSALSGKGSTSQGIFGSLLSSMFGGGGGGGVTAGPAPAGGYGGYAGYANTLPGFAGGGDTPAGTPFMVGENGPEVLVSGTRGHVYNKRQLAGMGGGGDVYVSITNTTDSKVSARKGKGAGGQMQVDILVEALESKLSSRLSRGQGGLGKTMEGTYGLQRVGR